MQWLTDLWLEFRIGMYYHLWIMYERRQHLDRMCQLICQRSLRQVAKMEREKGLA